MLSSMLQDRIPGRRNLRDDELGRLSSSSASLGWALGCCCGCCGRRRGLVMTATTAGGEFRGDVGEPGIAALRRRGDGFPVVGGTTA